MQLGVEVYLDMIYDRPDTIEHLLRINSAYCVAWANAQIKAGASAIMCADPALSPTIMHKDISQRYGIDTAKWVISRIDGPAMIHFASCSGLDLVDEVYDCGSIGMSPCADEGIGDLKAACRNKMTVVGGLNALEMRNWRPDQAEREVRRILAAAGPGGGFVLSDNHGEIPFCVDDEVLLAVTEAVRRWGRYPLDWVASYDE